MKELARSDLCRFDTSDKKGGKESDWLEGAADSEQSISEKVPASPMGLWHKDCLGGLCTTQMARCSADIMHKCTRKLFGVRSPNFRN